MAALQNGSESPLHLEKLCGQVAVSQPPLYQLGSQTAFVEAPVVILTSVT